MQRFRSLSVVLATGLVSGAFLAHADPDTAAQAAARAALQQQMNQTDTEQSASSTNLVTPPTPPAAPAEPAEPPAVSTPTPPAIPTPTPQFSTNIPMNVSTNVPMNDGMESDMTGMSQTNESATAQVKSQKNMAPVAAPPPLVLNTNETEQYPVNPAMAPLPPPPPEGSSAPPVTPVLHPVSIPGLGSDSQAPTVTQPNPGQQLPPSAPTGPAGPSLQGEQNSTNAVPNFEKITAPPLPISPEKQAELQSLLSQYLANQITPGQYQVQRAKIMAEP